MSSKKRSAKAKRVAEFKAHLTDADGYPASLDGAFAREGERRSAAAKKKEEALRVKACESKNRYSCRSDAEEAIASCARYGTKGLHCYRCPYCNGWHLTSKPVRGEQR